MKNRKAISSFAPGEVRRFIAPFTLSSIFFMMVIILAGIFLEPKPNHIMVIYGTVGIIYIIIFDSLVTKTTFFRPTIYWFTSTISGIGLGVLVYILPPYLSEVFHLLVVFGVIGVATISGRFQAYVTMLVTLVVSLFHDILIFATPQTILEYIEPFILSVIAMEIFLRIKDTTQQHIHRLETINKVSRQIMQSLDMEETISLLNATIPDTLEADTYYIGILKGEEIQLDLFYDDGQHFSGIRVPVDGTLSGWVIRNQKELFLPDLREDVQLDGVKMYIIGKEKTSLSWVGVPLKTTNVTGVIALASYQANAFDHADLELLSSLAQHITLALDNTIRHAQVEEQARLDSLTGVFNHGYFLKRLAEQAEETTKSNSPLSLIMLDIDYFKQYNDTYGHLVGDQILNTLCTAIKQHIKQSDAVGRWGGEEFIISLPGATGDKALLVAQRIGETMAGLRVEDRDQKTVPVPTVSQGIAVFPNEANDIYSLIDLADRRLYVAKERGRNQIEPRASHWEKINAG